VPTTDTLAFLRSTEVFAAIPERELHAVAAVAREVQVGARHYVFIEGEPAQWFCLVRSGRVRILRQGRSGKDVVLELLGPGEPFGGVAVIESRPYPASAQAIEPSAVVKIPAAPIVGLAARHPSLVKSMALMIGRRLRSAHESVKSLSVDPADARLAATLLRLAEGGGATAQRGGTVPFHLTRQGLADMTGVTVETAIRVLSRWQKEGIVGDDHGRLLLVDVATLREIAEGTD